MNFQDCDDSHTKEGANCSAWQFDVELKLL